MPNQTAKAKTNATAKTQRREGRREENKHAETSSRKSVLRRLGDLLSENMETSSSRLPSRVRVFAVVFGAGKTL
jgi:hypothetical protein